MRHNIIDISSNEKIKEVYDIFSSLKNKKEAHDFFGISDNSNGIKYLEEIASKVGFDISSYKRKEKKYCIVCGKEINSRFATKFCSHSCANSYNNKQRSDEIYKKIAAKLKKNKTKDKKIKEKKHMSCKNCGKELLNNNGVFCSQSCSSEYRHKMAYLDFLNNNEKYCKGNYTPKAFKKDIVNEQNGRCAICNCLPEHNGKPLVFILDHIDGDASNNKRENLRCICPNCDSQQDTYCYKNKHTYIGKRRPSKEELVNDILTLPLIKVGKKYNVSDNAVRKWLKKYKLPVKYKEIQEFKKQHIAP